MQIEVVEESFQQIAPRAAEVVTRFYEILFETDPRLRALFKGDMEAQKQHLIAALVTIVQNLRDPAALGAYLQALGQRHVGYGVTSIDYGTVGKSLLAAMSQTLKDQWNPQWTEQWSQAYGAVASLMQRS